MGCCAALCLIGTFAIVTDSYVNNMLPIFQQARPGILLSLRLSLRIYLTFVRPLGVSYVMGTVAWVVAVLTAFGVTVTGMAASRGYRWAAGPDGYLPING